MSSEKTGNLRNSPVLQNTHRFLCSYTECKLNPGSVTNIGITEDNKNSNGAAGLLVPGNNDSKSRKD